MSTQNAPALDRAGTNDVQIDDRTRRALDECMTVLPGDRDGAYTVVGENDETYQVDLHARACSCPDHEYRDAHCKQLRRCEVATGREPLPAHVADAVDVDPLLGDAVPGEVRVVASDGGIIVAGDDGEILDEADDDSRDRIEGPIPEFDKYGDYTGYTYVRCRDCGAEAMRRRDLDECCYISGDREFPVEVADE